MQQYTTAKKITTVGVRHWVVVTGIVSDIHNNPLVKAKVRIVEIKSRRKTTKANGKYRFTRLHINTTYTIEVIMSGYVTQTFAVNVNAAKTITHNFVMVATSGGTTTGTTTTGGTSTPS